jgi:hypothetical protein
MVGRNGLRFSHFPLGYPLWLLPPYLLGQSFSSDMVVPTREVRLPLVSYLLCCQANALALAIAAYFFHRIVSLFLPRRGALALTLIASLTSMAFPYAKIQAIDLLIGALLLGVVNQLLRAEGSRGRLVLAGLFFGYCLNCRANYGLAILGALAWCRHRRLPMAPLIAGVLPGLALLLGFNFLRFGSLFEFGYREPYSLNPLPGVYNAFFNPDYAMWIYSPVTGLAVYGWSRMRSSSLLRLTLLMTLPLLVFHLFHHGFDGGRVWGPRYCIPLLVVWNLGLIGLWGHFRPWSVAVVILSGLLQLWAMVIPTSNYWVDSELAGHVNGGLWKSVTEILILHHWPHLELWLLQPLPPTLTWSLGLPVALMLVVSSLLLARRNADADRH